MNIVITKEDIIRLYVDENKTMKEVGEALGASAATIFYKMKQYGIRSRTHEEAHRLLRERGWKMPQSAIQARLEKTRGRKVSDATKAKMSESNFKGGIGHKKKRPDGYMTIYFPEHPQATKDGYIMEHILVAECLRGKPLEEGECVHHINHNRSDNRACNLQVMTKQEHMRLHTKERHESNSIKYFSKPIKNITTNEFFESIASASRKYGVSTSSIRKACKKGSNCCGCKWEYIERSDDLST